MTATREINVEETGNPSTGGLRRVLTLLSFSWALAATPMAFARLFYMLGLKPGLVFRRFAKFYPGKLYCLPLNLGGDKRWKVHVRDNGFDAPMLIEFFHIHRMLNAAKLPYEPRVIYDLGANIGLASLFFGSLYPHAQIYGFEPVPDHYDLCRRNYRNLEKAEVFNWAIGARSGLMTFEMSEKDIRGGHLASGNAKSLDAGMRTFEVEVWSIDDLVTRKQLAPPDFLKIDVEGAELEVLEGLATCAGKVRYMQVETHSIALNEQCLRWLEGNGFKITGQERFTSEFGAIWAARR